MQSSTRYTRLTRWLKMSSMSWRNVPFEWKNREEEGWREGVERCGRIMISNRSQGEVEPKGTKEGQTEE